MVKPKRKHIAAVVSKRNPSQDTLENPLNIVYSDTSEEDNWVVVKKQRVVMAVSLSCSRYPSYSVKHPLMVVSLGCSGYITAVQLPLSSTRMKLGKRIIFNKTINLIPCCSTNAFVTMDDDMYGNKQVVSLTPQLYHYVLSNVREPGILRELREETATMRGSQMQVSPDQAQLLAMLVQLLGARRCIEVGVFTGYSSLAVALALPESGCLVACERDEKALEVARRFYQQAGVLHKVHIKHGLAVHSLESLLLEGEAGTYDFAFIDAEKNMYPKYFELLLKLVRVGGIIVVDNVLWHGKVADPLVNDSKTKNLRNFNRAIFEDERVTISLVPIGDGMTICRKR